MLVSGLIFIAENISKDIFKIHFLVTWSCFGLVFGIGYGMVASFFIYEGFASEIGLVIYDDN